MNRLNDRLALYISDPRNSKYNFNLAQEYEAQNHTAAAAGFYIRTAEFGGDDLLIYEALLRLALCFEKQGSRIFTTRGVLLRAISLMPWRPEAIFLLSRSYEINKDWQEAYTWATIGERLVYEGIAEPALRTNVQYNGAWLFQFEKAVAGWWIGLYDESVYLFRELHKNKQIPQDHAIIIQGNIEKLATTYQEPGIYDQSQYEHLKLKFKGAAEIKRNYSQVYQDLFVLTMLDGKRNGRYLEIGAGDPWFGNNTALLQELGWTGISIEKDQEKADKFDKERNVTVRCCDATEINYQAVLEKGDYDYLQIDTDPARVSMEVLKKIPFETHRFAVITFEHDHYDDEQSGVRERSREYLSSLGYELVAPDISPNDFMNFEDWWVHPELVPRDRIQTMKIRHGMTQKAEDYMITKT